MGADGSLDLTQDAGLRVIETVRWRFRICRYLFNLGALWIGLGYALLGIVAFGQGPHELQTLSIIVVVSGFAIFSIAFTLTLAIYRCPVCDKFIRRFRPNKEFCGSCGVRIRPSSSGDTDARSRAN
jgi:hypothetical protein